MLMEPLPSSHLLARRQNQSPRPSEVQNPNKDKDNHVGDIVGPIVGVIVLILLIFFGWYGYRVYRARKLGLPPPSINPFAPQPSVNTRNYPARGGVVGWLQAKYRSMRSGRTAGGAYETAGATRLGGVGAGAGGRRGLHTLDPDDAWDARVDREADADYEEQELGLTHSRNNSGYTGYDDMRSPYAPGRGIPRGADLDDRYEDETGRSTRGRSRDRDPFSDDAAERSDMGVRPVSPRPHHDASTRLDSKQDSPTERRSVFREDM